MLNNRTINEISHSRLFITRCKGVFWSWDTPAGKLRLERRYKEIAEQIKPNMNVLEVACGPGCFTQLLAKTNAHITAIDISADMLNFAKQSNNQSNILFKLEDACNTSNPVNTFDAIVGSSALHHLDLNQALGEFFRILKPGGQLYFWEPNMMNPQIFLQKNIPFLKEMACDSPDETAFFRWQLSRELLKKNFINIQIVPFDFLHPFIPTFAIPSARKLESLLEKTPLVKEIAGSLFIRGEKKS